MEISPNILRKPKINSCKESSCSSCNFLFFKIYIRLYSIIPCTRGSIHCIFLSTKQQSQTDNTPVQGITEVGLHFKCNDVNKSHAANVVKYYALCHKCTINALFPPTSFPPDLALTSYYYDSCSS